MNTPKISMIAAISQNRVIGRDNKLPWHISEDMKRFRRLTSGHVVVMGRKTYESIGRLLPNRINIIVTRDKEFNIDSAIIVHSLSEALQLAKDNEEMNQPDENKREIFILGGGQIFEQILEKADKLYLTVVDATIEGDAFFPEYSNFTKTVFEEKGESDGYSYTFIDLER